MLYAYLCLLYTLHGAHVTPTSYYAMPEALTTEPMDTGVWLSLGFLFENE